MQFAIESGIGEADQAAPAPAAVPAGWRIDAMAPDGYAVHAPSGAACIVRASDDSPRIVPTVVLADLCRDLLATTAAPAVAAPEPQSATLPAWWDEFVRNVCELPDRNSPEDEPDAMVATATELASCALRAIENVAPPPRISNERHRRHRGPPERHVRRPRP